MKVTSLTGKKIAETDWTPGKPGERTAELSPCRGAAIALDKLEPILRQAALDLDADLLLGVEVLSVSQDERDVVARLHPRDGSPELRPCRRLYDCLRRR